MAERKAIKKFDSNLASPLSSLIEMAKYVDETYQYCEERGIDTYSDRESTLYNAVANSMDELHENLSKLANYLQEVSVGKSTKKSKPVKKTMYENLEDFSTPELRGLNNALSNFECDSEILVGFFNKEYVDSLEVEDRIAECRKDLEQIEEGMVAFEHIALEKMKKSKKNVKKSTPWEHWEDCNITINGNACYPCDTIEQLAEGIRNVVESCDADTLHTYCSKVYGNAWAEHLTMEQIVYDIVRDLPTALEGDGELMSFDDDILGLNITVECGTDKSARKSKVAKREWTEDNYNPIHTEQDILNALVEKESQLGIAEPIKAQYIGTDWAMGSQYWAVMFRRNHYLFGDESRCYGVLTAIDWTYDNPERGIIFEYGAYDMTREEAEETFQWKIQRESGGTRKATKKSIPKADMCFADNVNKMRQNNYARTGNINTVMKKRD